MTDSTPSSVAAGGGVFLAHVVVKIYSIAGFAVGSSGLVAADGKLENLAGIARKRRTLLAFQASRVLENR